MTARLATAGFILLLPMRLAVGNPPQAVTAESIMARVAANQDQAVKFRQAYIYRQQILVRLRDNRGKLVREEDTELTVTPTPDGAKKEMTTFSGKYKAKRGGRMVAYTVPGMEAPDRHVDIDGDLVKELREDLVQEQKSKDGIATGLFPLTTQEQQRYDFRLAGNTTE